MKTRTIAALILVGGLAIAGCAKEPSVGGGASTGVSASGSASSSAAVADFNDVDVVFATTMIEDREEVVEMSEVLLAKDDIDGDVRKFADGVASSEDPEVEQLRELLEQWGVKPASASAASPGPEESSNLDGAMVALKAARGSEAARVYLEQMIVHHEGVVETAHREVVEGRNADAVILAQRIVNAQSAQIQQMKDLLEGLS